MKRLFSLLCAGAFVLAATSSALAQSTIDGSGHDFRTQAWAGNTGTTTADGDFCTVCHTPHNGASNAPLWDHALPADTTNVVFTLYTSSTSSTFDADDPTAVSGSSAVCLGCHDGQTALNAYGGSAGDGSTMTTEYPGSTANFGTDLSNDHPISINYQSAITNGDTELATAADALVSPMLRNGLVQCASCHDPHGAGFAFFARYDNAASAMCTRCHRK
jgi:predicted CXXCH cytochrome family protein